MFQRFRLQRASSGGFPYKHRAFRWVFQREQRIFCVGAATQPRTRWRLRASVERRHATCGSLQADKSNSKITHRENANLPWSHSGDCELAVALKPCSSTVCGSPSWMRAVHIATVGFCFSLFVERALRHQKNAGPKMIVVFDFWFWLQCCRVQAFCRSIPPGQTFISYDLFRAGQHRLLCLSALSLALFELQRS